MKVIETWVPRIPRTNYDEKPAAWFYWRLDQLWLQRPIKEQHGELRGYRPHPLKRSIVKNRRRNKRELIGRASRLRLWRRMKP